MGLLCSHVLCITRIVIYHQNGHTGTLVMHFSSNDERLLQKPMQSGSPASQGFAEISASRIILWDLRKLLWHGHTFPCPDTIPTPKVTSCLKLNGLLNEANKKYHPLIISTYLYYQRIHPLLIRFWLFTKTIYKCVLLTLYSRSR